MYPAKKRAKVLHSARFLKRNFHIVKIATSTFHYLLFTLINSILNFQLSTSFNFQLPTNLLYILPHRPPEIRYDCRIILA